MTITELKQKLDIVAVIGRHVSLTRKGTEHVGLCPFHNDTKPSLMVNPRKQLFSCFACGTGGDVVDFLVKRGMSHADILKTYGEPEMKTTRTTTRTSDAQTVGSMPASITHPRHGQPSGVWSYVTVDGELWGLVCRFDIAGSKEVLPYTHRNGRWQWKGFDEPRPLYNLPAVLAAQWVMIVEGEKAAEAGQQLFPSMAVTCWQGGASAVSKSDWSVLAGKNVVLWADNDEPGRQAMQQVARLIAHAVGKLLTVQAVEGMAAKWDLADGLAEGWTTKTAAEYLRANAVAVVTELPALMAESETAEPAKTDVVDEQADGEHFAVLGFVREENKTYYAIYAMANKVVNLFSASSLNTPNLISIAPLMFWQSYFPKPRGAFDVNAAADWIIRLADERGVFSMGSMRGRGVWLDEGRIVIHAGSHLVVDAQPHRLGTLSTRYIYEQAAAVRLSREVLTDAEAGRVFDFFDTLNFGRQLDKFLLAGWVALAPVCGALRWRPHIWITGPAGSGKSWIIQNPVRRLLGDMAIHVQGDTTEAGLRQLLGHDALPICFDEAESQDQQSRARIDGVLSFARAASTGEGGMVAKGSVTGKAQTYSVKTMLAMASILPSVTLKSDLGRFSVIEYGQANDVSWAEKQLMYHKTIDDTTGARMIARTMQHLPLLLKNIELMIAAVAGRIEDQRMADQLGTLLAGSMMFLGDFGTKELSSRVTETLFRRLNDDFTAEKQIAQGSDEETLRNLLLGGLIRMDGGKERTVSELCDIALGFVDEPFIEAQQAQDALLRHGFRADTEGLVVSSSHSEVRRILAGTQFERNHARTLMRLAGSAELSSVRFKGSIQRAVKILRP